MTTYWSPTFSDQLPQKRAYIMVGFPGSGKSTLAKQIAAQQQLVYLSSDAIRQELFQSERYSQAGHDMIQSLSLQAYAVMYERAANALAQNQRVVFDATHLHIQKRLQVIEKLLTMIEPHEAAFVCVKTPRPLIAERMKPRTEMTNDQETVYQGWKRVYNEFISDQKNGLIAWPDDSLGIDVIITK
jgi:uncharacterized protein